MRSDESGVGAVILAHIMGDEEAAKQAMSRELIKQAVCTQIFCPDCQTVLDMRTAVLVELVTKEHPDGTPIAVVCGPCADKHVPTWETMVTAASSKGMIASLIVHDGRKLYTSTGRRKG